MVLPDRGPLAKDLHAAGIELIIRPLSVIRREHASASGLARLTTAAARDAAALARLIRARDIALVHSNTSVIPGAAAAAALARVPHICHIREDYSRFGKVWPIYRQYLLRSAAALSCVSRATARQFGSDAKATVVHDGLAGRATRMEASAARQQLGVPENQPAIAVVGRISDWKGQDVLIRALAQPELSNAIGIIAGEAWPGAEDRLARVQELARVCAVSDRVRFVGFRDDVSIVYGAADLVAVPSTAPDPLPGAAIEAASAGCAVIASAHGGLPEIIRDGETGRLVAPGDAAALARVARQLLDDPRERERLGAAAAADVRVRFAPERLLDQVQALYDEL